MQHKGMAIIARRLQTAIILEIRLMRL